MLSSACPITHATASLPFQPKCLYLLSIWYASKFMFSGRKKRSLPISEPISASRDLRVTRNDKIHRSSLENASLSTLTLKNVHCEAGAMARRLRMLAGGLRLPVPPAPGEHDTPFLTSDDHSHSSTPTTPKHTKKVLK